jgi:DNA-binding beta-propeller fold protein YncE
MHSDPWKLTTWSVIAIIAVLFAGCAAPPEKTDEKGPPVFPRPPDPARFVFERTILGTGSVRTLSERDNLRTLLTGAPVSEGVGFAKPFDVAVHQGRVYVTDTVHRSVLALDFPRGEGFVIGDRGDEGDLHKPLGIAVAGNGNIHVLDATLRGVHVYNPAGDFLRRIDLSAHTDRPSGLDVSPDETRLYVVDTGGVESENHRVLIIDGESGSLIRAIGTRGKADGEFNLPRDVRVGPDGLIYVTDGGNFRVQVFTQEGQHVRSWGRPGRRLGQFSRPKGISVDPSGNVYVVDAAFGNFQIFNPEGKLLLFVGDRSTDPEPAKFMLPAGIDVDEDGRVYMVYQFFRKLDIFRPVEIGEKDGWLGRTPAGSQ